jgi:alanine-glyoxylate transaminase/serine-glyoxylate transaminase/serine-pyruvate transaminase
MPTSVVEALGAAAGRILAEGLDAYQARHAEAARRVRRGLEELGFELLVADDVASPVTTAALPKPGMDVDHYTDWLRREHRLRIAPGIGDLAGKIFRVGHMGRAAEPEVVSAYLAATAAYLEEAELS